MSKIENKLYISDIKRYYHYTHQKDYVFYGHRHAEFELNILQKGEMEVTCEGNVYIIGGDTALLISPHTFHQNRVIGDLEAEMIVVQFNTPDILTQDMAALYCLDDELKAILTLFFSNMESKAEVFGGSCLSIQESAKKLFELFFQYAYELKKQPHPHRNIDALIYNEAVNFMYENITAKISVSDISKKCGVCKTILKRIFSHYTGRGCICFFNELKLEYAKKLLASGKTCSYVSDYLGFSSQAYFTKKFKQEYNISPGKFKTTLIDV